jgi:hypothetical protein
MIWRLPWRRDHYEIVTGSADLVRLFKSGVRVQPKNLRTFKA